MHDNKLAARHSRCYGRGHEILDLEHYLDVLERKPGAMKGCTPLQQWRQAGRWPACLDAIWRELEQRHGKSKGTREMIALVRAGSIDGLGEADRCCKRCIASGHQRFSGGAASAAYARSGTAPPVRRCPRRRTAPVRAPHAGHGHHRHHELAVFRVNDSVSEPSALQAAAGPDHGSCPHHRNRNRALPLPAHPGKEQKALSRPTRASQNSAPRERGLCTKPSGVPVQRVQFAYCCADGAGALFA